MSDKEILQQATEVFKRDYPALTAEAIMCFLVAADLDEPTVGDVAQVVGYAEPQAYQHISPLTGSGAGLVVLTNTGGGANTIGLTEAGQKLKEAINSIDA